ncbi:PBP1A family penicillin-binding protein [Paenibacillus gansuensis]|uniref:PBP1A family penicillin-binding protein n=1 Tax=Paenibacillus gansuensis TaxID=306542 RepID=A0ABW5PA11_9BACL
MTEQKDTNKRPNSNPAASRGKKKRKKGKTILIWFFITAALGVFCALAGYLFIILSGEKIFKENIDKLTLSESSIVYDSQGAAVKKLVADRIDRELVSLKDIPEKLQDAFIATEDRRFEQHQGVDLWSLGRAVVKDVVNRSAVEGGSTITQQLAKNLFLNSDKTIFRKATEVSIALALENNLSKDEILEKYLNRIYFGKSAYGVKSAAKRYFGKGDLNDLKIAEMAILAAIPKAPNTYNPINNPEKSLERRKVVLSLMYSQGYITAEEKAEAEAYVYKPIPDPSNNDVYTTYLDYVTKEAAKVTKLSEEEIMTKGLKIHTNLNVQAQKAAEAAFADDDLFPKDGELDGKPYPVQGAMTIVNNANGGIVAMVGGRDVNTGDLNRATVPRQPGSSFKPVAVYGPALESGDWNPYSSLNNEKQCFGDYCPRNLGGGYSNSISMMDAVEHSTNIPSVWLLDQIGVKTGYNFAKNLGLPLGNDDKNLAIALGGLTKGVSTLDMAQAYSAFANQGRLNKAHAIERIEDSSGREIYSAGKPEQKQVMSKQTAYSITQLLENVVQNGSGKKARIDRPVAGKTGTAGYKGTSSGNQDIWFAGYTNEYTAAVYMGFDRTSKKNYLRVSSSTTARMFGKVMEKALSGRPVKDFVRPEGVVDYTQPSSSVKDLAAAYTPEDNSVTLTWSPKEGNNEYQVFRKESAEAEFTQIATVQDAGMVDRSIAQGGSYEYFVIVYNPQNNTSSKQSNHVTIVAAGVVEQPVEPPVVDPGEGPDIPIEGGNGGAGNGNDNTGTGNNGGDGGTDDGTVPPDGGNGQVPDNGTGGNSGNGTGSPDNGTGGTPGNTGGTPDQTNVDPGTPVNGTKTPGADGNAGGNGKGKGKDTAVVVTPPVTN